MIDWAVFDCAGTYQIVMTLHTRTYNLPVRAEITASDGRVVAEGFIVSANGLVRVARTVGGQVCFLASLATDDKALR